jgi:hypothetical protein
MSISEFAHLRGRSLTAVLEAVGGVVSGAWDLAAFQVGLSTILLHLLGSRGPAYDAEALRRLLLALQAGEIWFEATTPDGRRVIVPGEFWRDSWRFLPDTETLQSLPDGPAYLSPHLVVGALVSVSAELPLSVPAIAATVPVLLDEPPGAPPAKKSIREIIEDHVKDRAIKRRPPSQPDAVKLVRKEYPKTSVEAAREHYRVVTGRGKQHRGRPKSSK